MSDAGRFSAWSTAGRRREPAASATGEARSDRASRGLSAGGAALLGMLIMMGGYLVIASDPSRRTDITARLSERAFREAIKDYRPVPFSVLSGFYYRDGMSLASLPQEIRAANGVKVALHGFIVPLDVSSKGVTQFLLNGSYDRCQFGVSAGAPNQWVDVAMTNGGSIPYTHSPITVLGTFSVSERRRDGHVMALYHLAADQVIGAEP